MFIVSIGLYLKGHNYFSYISQKVVNVSNGHFITPFGSNEEVSTSQLTKKYVVYHIGLPRVPEKLAQKTTDNYGVV